MLSIRKQERDGCIKIIIREKNTSDEKRSLQNGFQLSTLLFLERRKFKEYNDYNKKYVNKMQ